MIRLPGLLLPHGYLFNSLLLSPSILFLSMSFSNLSSSFLSFLSFFPWSSTPCFWPSYSLLDINYNQSAVKKNSRTSFRLPKAIKYWLTFIFCEGVEGQACTNRKPVMHQSNDNIKLHHLLAFDWYKINNWKYRDTPSYKIRNLTPTNFTVYIWQIDRKRHEGNIFLISVKGKRPSN